MIKAFKDKEAKKIFTGQFSKKLPQDIQRKARMKLRMLDATTCLNDLLIPPANRLEELKGNRKGQHSIRINKQYSGLSLGNTMNRISNIHPGEVLFEEFLEPLNISQNKLARTMAVPPRRINEIVLGKRSVTADTAIRLGKAFGMSAQFWINLQSVYDIEKVKLIKEAEFDAIEKIVA